MQWHDCLAGSARYKCKKAKMVPPLPRVLAIFGWNARKSFETLPRLSRLQQRYLRKTSRSICVVKRPVLPHREARIGNRRLRARDAQISAGIRMPKNGAARLTSIGLLAQSHDMQMSRCRDATMRSRLPRYLPRALPRIAHDRPRQARQTVRQNAGEHG
jgi:hypothetical protein